jgi:hypothetical protein
VTLQTGVWREELALQPGEERLVDLPLAAGMIGTRLTITNSAGIRPIDFEPGSHDARNLGCWIEWR